MPVQQLKIYPDVSLSKEATPVKNPQHPDTVQLVQDLKDTLQHHYGLGLAANQIGILQRVFVLNMDVLNADPSLQLEAGERETGMRVFINPEVVEKHGLEKFPEACLSIPGVKAKIERAPYIKIKATDEVGQPFEYEAVGYAAAAIQHEMSHLDGVTIFELMGPVTKRIEKKKYKKLLGRFKNLNASIQRQLK